jgi:hypothetical protein
MSDASPDNDKVKSPVSGNPDPDTFYEIVFKKTMRTHQGLDPSTMSPLYTIIEHETVFRRNKPDIRLYAGPDKEHPMVGVVKIGPKFSREHKIGLGDPNAPLSEDAAGERMIWEALRSTSQNCRGYRTYPFEYGEWQVRKVYTWRRPTDRWKNYVGTLELRAGGEEDAEGELLAKWRCRSRWTQKIGSLYIKKIEGDAKERNKWELMVLLSAQSIIEAAVRRAK